MATRDGQKPWKTSRELREGFGGSKKANLQPKILPVRGGKGGVGLDKSKKGVKEEKEQTINYTKDQIPKPWKEGKGGVNY